MRIASLGSSVFMLAAAAGVATAGVDSMLVSRKLPSSWLNQDINMDGVVTDSDAALLLLEQLQTELGTDQDGDGQVTPGDLVLLVSRTVLTSAGDFNGDGDVNEQDTLDAIDTFIQGGAFDPKNDADGDGEVTFNDVYTIMEKVSADTILYDYNHALITMSQYVQYGSDHGTSLFMSDQSDTTGHHTVISQGWDVPPGTHDTHASLKKFPPNHVKSLSDSWPTTPPGAPWQEPTYPKWPANHRTFESGTWNPPPNHQEAQSQQDAPGGYHNTTRSEQWKHAPGHVRSFSATWPASHDTDMSRQWAPNHTSENSVLSPHSPVGVHQTATTCGWFDWGTDCNPANYHPTPPPPIPGVVPDRWINWPPNHVTENSVSWIAHNRALSLSWPANHRGIVSNTWPERLLPYQWPPNHLVSVTREEDQGEPPVRGPGDWPLFPDNHDWLTTTREILDVPGQIIPLLPTRRTTNQ